VSHILRNRTINPSTGVATDRWFHYDQVGSVLSESDAAGALEQTHHQDAFGNTQAAWQTGLWGGDRAGWHHNTKELDGDTGLVYMHQRWYSPETGTFMSSAPYPVTVEHRYGFAEADPVGIIDPMGTYILPYGKLPIVGRNNLRPGEVRILSSLPWDTYLRVMTCYARGLFVGTNRGDDYGNALRHCVWNCCLIEIPREYIDIGTVVGLVDAHEEGETAGNPDHEADKINNKIGRGIGASRCDGDSRSCETKCKEAYSKGRLARASKM
jgi:RHS repeat-associated protein